MFREDVAGASELSAVGSEVDDRLPPLASLNRRRSATATGLPKPYSALASANTSTMYYASKDVEVDRRSRLLATYAGSVDRKFSPTSTNSSASSAQRSKETGLVERAKLNIFTTRASSVLSKFSNANLNSNNGIMKSNFDETPEVETTRMYKLEPASILELHTAAAKSVDHPPPPLPPPEPDRPLEILVQPSAESQTQRVPANEAPMSNHVEIALGTCTRDEKLEAEQTFKFDPKTTTAESGAGVEEGDNKVRSHKREHHHQEANSIYFKDGKRLVDFVLVFVTGHLKKADLSRAGRIIEKEKQRLYFEDNLRKDGLELEEDVHVHEGPHAERTTFVKVHAPWQVLCRQAETLKMKQPTRLHDPYADAPLSDGPQTFLKALRAVKAAAAAANGSDNNNRTDASAHESGPGASSAQGPPITWPFSRKYIEMFAVEDRRTFFWPSRRQEIVWEVLQNAHNDPDDEKRRGIESLLERGVYESAFPLHDGPYESRREQKQSDMCERQLLKRTWADWKSVFRYQPLPLIRKYYGEKVGFYFAFLGFYANMLIFPSIVGLVTFFYGMFYEGDDIIIEDICDHTKAPGNYTMCPLCQPPYCQFTQLYEACLNAKWDYRLDNEATVVMSITTVVWATVMLKLWKRRQAELAFEWDTYDVKIEDSVVRPEFEERAPAKRRHPVTRELEPYVPKSTKLLWLTASTCVTLFMLCAVGGALSALVIARVQLYWAFTRLGFHDSNVELARWTVHGLIFIVVLLFEKTYSIIAHKLTSFECPRTQQEWLSSFLWKVFIFALLNDFVPIGYAAWVKGRLSTTPLELSWHTELCDTGGCMSEVTELISVLLLCRLVLGNFFEIGLPFVQNAWTRLHEQFGFKALFKRLRNCLFKKKPPKNSNGDRKSSKRTLERHDAQWHRDFMLGELEEDAVWPEYLEMIVQFAFVTLFIPALPLAPLVCLLNNVVEIRIDAVKFITAHRKPLPVRAPGSQIWNDFLNVIGKLAVVCNAGLISFTSNVLPRLYYKFATNGGASYENFVNSSLSQLEHIHYDDVKREHFFEHNVSACFYEDYRKAEPPFDHTEMWWEIQCIRLAAFAFFLVLSFTFQWLFNFIVADVPARVSLKIQRRRYVVTRAIEAMAGADAFKQRRIRGKMDQFDSVRGKSPMFDNENGRPETGGVAGGSKAVFETRPVSEAARRRKGGRQESVAVTSVADEVQHNSNEN